MSCNRTQIFPCEIMMAVSPRTPYSRVPIYLLSPQKSSISLEEDIHIWEATYFSLNRVQVTDNWWTNFDPKKLEVKVLWKKTSKDATWRTASQNNIATTEKLSIFGSEKKIYWKLGRDLHTLGTAGGHSVWTPSSKKIALHRLGVVLAKGSS